MNNNKSCPCCSATLLRYARTSGVYWYCVHCRQEMPDLASVIEASKQRQRLEKLESLVSRQDHEIATVS